MHKNGGGPYPSTGSSWPEIIARGELFTRHGDRDSSKDGVMANPGVYDMIPNAQMSDTQTLPKELSDAEVYSMTEIFLVALCLFREARSEGVEGMQKVYDVIANRAADTAKRWPRSRMGVVLQPKQFSCFNIGDGQSSTFPQIKTVSEWLAWIQATRIVQRGIVTTPDINHYHTKDVEPKWAEGKTVVLEEKNHVFYAF
jgi:spore germination cell wall hydrolase CwlJ-like protein